MKYKDRIKELRRVKASDILPNPKNWRTHPDSQREALSGVLETVGIADAVLAMELPNGRLMMVDGHLRKDILGNQEVPVIVLDITPEEADFVLLTHDSLAGMAEFDEGKLNDLIGSFDLSDERFAALIDSLSSEVEEEKTETPKRSHHSESTESFDEPDAKFKDAGEIHTYTLVFDKSDQKATWFEFIRWLNSEVEGETIGERLANYIKENGLCLP